MVFEVADYKSDNKFSKNKIADPKWRMTPKNVINFLQK